MIKTIIQTWKTVDLSQAPPLFEISRKSWQSQNPSWSYHFFDDEAIDAFVRDHLPEFHKNVFVKYEAQIQRVDIFRIVYMFFEGGIYSDLDAEAINPFEQKGFDLNGIILGTLANKESSQHVPNAFLYAGQTHGTFWAFVLATAVQRSKESKGYDGAEYLTGPQLLTSAYYDFISIDAPAHESMISTWVPELEAEEFQRKNTPIQLLDPVRIYPLDWTETSTEQLNTILRIRLESDILPEAADPNQTICINYWTHSWEIPSRGILHAVKSKINWLLSNLRR